MIGVPGNDGLRTITSNFRCAQHPSLLPHAGHRHDDDCDNQSLYQSDGRQAAGARDAAPPDGDAGHQQKCRSGTIGEAKRGVGLRQKLAVFRRIAARRCKVEQFRQAHQGKRKQQDRNVGQHRRLQSLPMARHQHGQRRRAVEDVVRQLRPREREEDDNAKKCQPQEAVERVPPLPAQATDLGQQQS